MNQQSRDLRREANRAFLESLQTLEADIQAASTAPTHSLTTPPCTPVEALPAHPEPESATSFTPSELEQAIADIDQYLQQQTG